MTMFVERDSSMRKISQFLVQSVVLKLLKLRISVCQVSLNICLENLLLKFIFIYFYSARSHKFGRQAYGGGDDEDDDYQGSYSGYNPVGGNDLEDSSDSYTYEGDSSEEDTSDEEES